ncbi:MAG: ATPase domain-containing protein [Candidatus Thermoplasmatota archaeon]|nr:ATPase domain-containing protein [Candidatus Thermoplasmatota archaeon]
MYETEISQEQNHEEHILKTNIPGFDELFEKRGIPKGSSIMVAGGPGTGKSTFCRQICVNQIQQGKRCMYVSFEESKDRIMQSIESFGWQVNDAVESEDFLIQNINPLDILRMKFGSLGGSGSATELSYKIKPLVIPKEFEPDVIVVDSLSAIIAASVTKEKNYRVYLQQLFSFFEDTGATSLLISETDPLPTRFSDSGIEEFLADGIIVLYNAKVDQQRKNAIEILKMRYGKHIKKIVSMEITSTGIQVYPDQTVPISF